MRTELADLCRRAVVVSVGSFGKVARPWPSVEEGLHRLCLAWREMEATPRVVLG